MIKKCCYICYKLIKSDEDIPVNVNACIKCAEDHMWSVDEARRV